MHQCEHMFTTMLEYCTYRCKIIESDSYKFVMVFVVTMPTLLVFYMDIQGNPRKTANRAIPPEPTAALQLVFAFAIVMPV